MENHDTASHTHRNGVHRQATKPLVNLDWTRDPPPARMTSWQKFIRSVDWSNTSLGPMRSWARELRQTVLLMMAETNPVILYWGQESTMIYNEAYAPLIGKQHPQNQGKRAWDVFPDFWAGYDHVIRQQWETGETSTGDASLHMLEHHGFVEETYFNWQLIPVIGDDGYMLGSYGRPSDVSHETIHARRVACIQSLSQRTNGLASFDDLWHGVVCDLAMNEKDIPLFMIYTIQQQWSTATSSLQSTSKCKLGALLGISSEHPCAKAEIDLEQDSSALAPHMLTAFQTEAMHTITTSDSTLGSFFTDVDWRGFGIPCHEFVFVPIKAAGTIAAIVVLGLNPRLRFEGDYLEFIQIVAEVLSSQITKLIFTEEANIRDAATRKVVEEFKRSEMKFARFADRSPLGLTLTDKNGRVMYANEAWYSFCGLQKTENHSPSWVDTVYEDDLHIIEYNWHRVIQLKESTTFQIRSKQPFVSDGMRSPYRTGIVAIYPDLDSEGNIATIMGLVTDISELKWTEAQLLLRQHELEESESKYKTFAEHAPIGVVLTDSEGYVQFSNDAWRSFYNLSRDHVLTDPCPWLKSLNQEDVPVAKEFFEDIIKTKSARTVEVRLRRTKSSTGQEFWLLCTGFVDIGLDGSVSNVTFWVTDISDQKAAEKILTAKMEEAIQLKNTQEQFMSSVSHEIRNPLSATYHCADEIVESMKLCLNLMEQNTGLSTETYGERSSEPDLRVHIGNALEAANLVLYCVNHQRQIIDDVLTLSKLDSQLLVVSPVPVQPETLLGSALKIFEPELKATDIEMTFEMEKSLKELDIDWIMLDPNRFLQIVINLVTNAIKFTKTSSTRRIVISVTARKEPPPRQDLDVHYVPKREVANNAEHGKPEDQADLSEPTDDDLYLCFRITDTGKGLTDAECTLLFNRFAQASPRTHVEYGGSGLGLFISRQITEMLGGEIGVGSQPGKGATFAFYVRSRKVPPPRRGSITAEHSSTTSGTRPGQVVRSQPSKADRSGGKTGFESPKRSGKSSAGKSSVESASATDPRSRRVLVVEDNLVNQKVLCKQLRNRGFIVEAANHGKEALDILESSYKREATDRTSPNSGSYQFDVILCDIEMPIMGGIECVTEIRRLEADGKFQGHIPIIGVTANVGSSQVQAAIDAGMDGVTTKPYRMDELIEHIDVVFEKVEGGEP